MTETAAVAAANALSQQALDPQEARRQFRDSAVAWDAETSRLRRPLYQDVEELIHVGFISHQVVVGDVRMSIRSLSPGDIHLLSHRCGRNAENNHWKLWSLATAIWMVNGESLLEDTAAVSSMYRIVRQFPKGVVDILFSVLLGLFNRTGSALARTEAYCYEPYSRVSWRMYGRQVPSMTRLGGIPGVDRLGLNHIQRLWVAFNLSEDDREVLLREWQAAKLVASAMSPKGIRKINEADSRLQEREEQRRREVAEAMVHQILYGEHLIEETSWKVRVQGQTVEVPAVKVARTPEELDDQFRAWVTGQKDWHDIVVDTYKARITAQFQDEKNAREDALQGLTREVGVQGGLLDGQLVGYTPDQLRDLRPDLLARKPGARRVADGPVPMALYEKYVARPAEPGRLRVEGDKVYETDGPASLMERVEGRRPQFSTEPIDPGNGE